MQYVIFQVLYFHIFKMFFKITSIQIFCFVQIVTFCFLLSLQANVRCKGNSNIFCTCQKKEVKCKGIQDIDILKTDLLFASQNCSATKLHISSSQMAALPNNMLNGSNFTEMRIDYSEFPFLVAPIAGKNPFIGGILIKMNLESVNYPYNWNWTLLNVCENLKELHIIKSNMLYVGPTFNTLNLPNLKSLKIQNSRVRWIHKKAFASLSGLTFLNLINNELQSFKRRLLPNPAENLAVINLRNNLLEYLDEDIFENMPLLVFVNLENNNLMKMSEFKNTGKFVLLSGNPLQCDCKIEWMKNVMNATDSYRLHCYMSSGDSILIKNVDWKKLDC